MIKNEKFYERAYKLRDNQPNCPHNSFIINGIICDIQRELFLHNDNFSDKLIFRNYHTSLEMVRYVLLNLGINYSSASKCGDCFIIQNPKFVEPKTS